MFYLYICILCLLLLVTLAYVSLGYPSAQRYLHGKGVEKHQLKAMEWFTWFRKAFDQGHPHASYNLAVGHLKTSNKTDMRQGEAHQLIHHAASKGVKQAHKVLNEICARGGCALFTRISQQQCPFLGTTFNLAAGHTNQIMLPLIAHVAQQHNSITTT